MTKSDPLSPRHYKDSSLQETIELIARAFTREQFWGYCQGNIIKYRMRAGLKLDATQDLGKADKYIELYNRNKELCKED